LGVVHDDIVEIPAYIAICHHCSCPTLIDTHRRQYPAAKLGSRVSGLSDENIAILYEEARLAHGAGCHTLVAMACRKILMNIAVNQGAIEGEPFSNYVQFLSDNHFVPPDSHQWVDHIRKQGNKANHEITQTSKEDAETLINFVEMILKFVYEFPAKVQSKTESE
jgi:hypothetical protein